MHCPKIRPTQKTNEQSHAVKAEFILAYSFHPCTLDAPKQTLEVWVVQSIRAPALQSAQEGRRTRGEEEGMGTQP